MNLSNSSLYEQYKTNIIASKKRWLRRQPVARLSVLNFGVRLFF
jgi:hypothetical protein